MGAGNDGGAVEHLRLEAVNAAKYILSGALDHYTPSERSALLVNAADQIYAFLVKGTVPEKVDEMIRRPPRSPVVVA